jgi:tetratricopeptide (TPR) repeat protein
MEKNPGEPKPETGILAERLRIARRTAHLTQQQLAEKGFSRSSLSAIERGKMLPTLPVLAALAETLVVPRSYLLGEIEIAESALEESRSVIDAAAASTHQVKEHEARQRLSQAGTLIRRDQAAEAWRCLGESDATPVGWPLLLRPHWAWLAGWTLYLLDRPADAVPVLEEGLQLAKYLRMRAHPDQYDSWDEMSAWLYCILGGTHCGLGHNVMALLCYQRGLERIDQGRFGKAELKLLLYKGLGREYFALASYEEAIGCYKKALDFAPDCDNKRQHCLAAWGLAVVYEQRAVIQERQRNLIWAKVYYRRALEALGEHENRQLLAQLLAHYGLVLIELKEYEEAELQLQKSLDSARESNDLHTCGMALAYFASLHNARGDSNQAIGAAQASLPFLRKSGDQRAEAHAQFMLIDAYTAKRDWAAAEQIYNEIIQLARQIADYEILSHARKSFADFLAERARYEEAFNEMKLMGPA